MMSTHDIPVIDLESFRSEQDLIEVIVAACSEYGFFQITSHGIEAALIESIRKQCADYFGLPLETKKAWKRSENNARGFFDDELTKRRLDWKQCLDVGVPGTRDWSVPDSAIENRCLDGWNQLPSNDELPGFRDTLIQYFDACARLSHRIAVLMAKGMNHSEDTEFIRQLRSEHTSYLRVNYYPPCDSKEKPPPLGISPHRDAGFLTVLLQDDKCHSLEVWKDEAWKKVKPVPGAFTINTGDMAQIWSNGKYKAPLHRVLTCDKERYSAPFFYNPGYDRYVFPSNTEAPIYYPVLWGYFRALRFAGDLTDLGVEIQIDHFEIGPHVSSKHRETQAAFAKLCNFSEPFSVEKYIDLLQDDNGNQENSDTVQIV